MRSMLVPILAAVVAAVVGVFMVIHSSLPGMVMYLYLGPPDVRSKMEVMDRPAAALTPTADWPLSCRTGRVVMGPAWPAGAVSAKRMAGTSLGMPIAAVHVPKGVSEFRTSWNENIDEFDLPFGRGTTVGSGPWRRSYNGIVVGSPSRSDLLILSRNGRPGFMNAEILLFRSPGPGGEMQLSKVSFDIPQPDVTLASDVRRFLGRPYATIEGAGACGGSTFYVYGPPGSPVTVESFRHFDVCVADGGPAGVAPMNCSSANASRVRWIGMEVYENFARVVMQDGDIAYRNRYGGTVKPTVFMRDD